MTDDSRVLTRILKADCCTGCGICAAVAGGKIEMHTTPAGFLRPRQNRGLTVAEDNLIAAICPGIRLDQRSTEGVDHPIWGPFVGVRVGASTDGQLRFHASSGGVLSAILLYLLDSDTVDYVVQTAANEEAPIENIVVESVGRDNIYAAAGSRYAPSAPLENLSAQLARPGRFAFVGKPCDVAALRALSRYDPRVARKIPVVLSFFCAGVPSLTGVRRILKELRVEEQELLTFRYRGDGWPGYATAMTRDGSEKRMSYADSWGKILSNHLQFRCKVCPDGSGGFADIVCGDAWYSDENGYPRFAEEEGRSLIVSRTTLGEELLIKATAAGYIDARPLDVGEIAKMQPSQARRKRVVLARLSAMAALGRTKPRFRGFQLLRAARSAGLWANLRSFLGMARRLIISRPGRVLS